jgi:hypothetical protein
MTDDLANRALAAYFREAAAQDGQADQPSRPEIVEHDGKRFIVLGNVSGALKVYRVLTVNGKDVLKGYKRIPPWADAIYA